MNERLPFLREKTAQLTSSPGVYLMKDKSGKIIYIGKAKRLKNRVTSYFRENADHLPKVGKMVSLVNDYDFIVTDSEYEALLLECSLIKQYSPKYNILLKDDKGYHYIKISAGDYPKITAEMQKNGDGTYLGPYTSSFTTRQAVDEANRVFMLPTCKKNFPTEFGRARPCLNHHIKQCMGVCSGKIPRELYLETIAQAVEYIKSGSISSVERLEGEMLAEAEALHFERAALLRDRISAIKHAADRQKIITGLRDTDIIGTAEGGGFCGLTVLIYRGGRLTDKVDFFLGEMDSESVNDSIEAFIAQYYQNKGDIPREILLESELQDELLSRLLCERAGRNVAVTVPKRGDGVKLLQLAKSNAAEYLSFKVGRTGKEISALEELAKLLGLTAPPLYIESYDISNLGSTAMVAGMVVFEEGRPLKSAYKRFSIKDVAVQNDVACMSEVLERRFRHYLDAEEKDSAFRRLPDLILLDGGKGQVGAVVPLLKAMGVNVPVFGMVKDNKHRTRAIATNGGEIAISDKKSAFYLVTRIQDEVHRFSIAYQRKQHSARTYALEITKIKGIGEKRAAKFYKKLGTKEARRAATAEEIAAIMGVGADVAEKVREFFNKD